MAVTDRTLAVLDHIRIDLDRRVDAETRLIVEAWARAWAELRPTWSAAIDQIADIHRQGKRPTRRQIDEALRATRAMMATQDAIVSLAREQGVRITGGLPDLAAVAARLQADALGSSLPTVIPPGHALAGAVFDRVDPAALDAIVKRTTRQVTSLLRPLPREATAAMKSLLIRGVALGLHPSRSRDGFVSVAQLLMERVGDGFTGGMARAVNVARTEMIDAHRAAARAQDLANPDIVAGWQWLASLTPRTCPACFSMHGTIHPAEEFGPLGHQQCRCARGVVSKSWRDLGFDIPEPPSAVPDALSTFRAMPRDDQVAVLGQAKLDLLNSGQIEWSDLAMRRSTDGWRDSMVPTPLADLKALAARRAA